MFIASDTVIATEQFLSSTELWGITWPLYYLGQFYIVTGFLKLLQRHYADVTKNWTENTNDLTSALEKLGVDLPRANLQTNEIGDEEEDDEDDPFDMKQE